MAEEPIQNKKEVRIPQWAEAMRMFGDITTWIAVPIVLALVVGKYLDRRYGTEPILFLSLAGLGFIMTSYGIVKIVRAYNKKAK